MKLEFSNNKKINRRILKEELGCKFKVIQEPHTITLPDDEIEYHGWIIEIDDSDIPQGKDARAIAKAHSPEKDDNEEGKDKKEENELPALKRKLLRALRKDAAFRAAVKEEILK